MLVKAARRCRAIQVQDGTHAITAADAPGPDVLDIDVHQDGTGYPALCQCRVSQLKREGLVPDTLVVVSTPSGGFTCISAGDTARGEHNRLIDLYHAGLIDMTEFQRRAASITTVLAHLLGEPLCPDKHCRGYRQT